MKFGLILFIVSILFSFILLNPQVKEKTMSLFLDSGRSVLSQMDYEFEQSRYKVLKIMTLKGLRVEMYRYTDDGLMLVDAQDLTDKKDAYYKFGEKKHNLFLQDVNGDGSSEIILPSIDKNMKARLNVFIFNSESEKLEKVTQH